MGWRSFMRTANCGWNATFTTRARVLMKPAEVTVDLSAYTRAHTRAHILRTMCEVWNFEILLHLVPFLEGVGAGSAVVWYYVLCADLTPLGVNQIRWVHTHTYTAHDRRVLTAVLLSRFGADFMPDEISVLKRYGYTLWWRPRVFRNGFTTNVASVISAAINAFAASTNHTKPPKQTTKQKPNNRIIKRT